MRGGWLDLLEVEYTCFMKLGTFYRFALGLKIIQRQWGGGRFG